MAATTTTTETLTAKNGETFTRGTYNGISVLIHDETGYVNGSKLGDEGRRARDFVNGERFNDICRFWVKTQSAPKHADPKYKLEYIGNDFKGTYVHPSLVHFVAEWVSVEYAFKVAHIMNSINEYSQATGQTFDETKDELIAQLQARIDEQQQQIQQLETKIAQTSVPDENCDKDLFIVRVNGQLKLCADNTHKPTQFIRRYRFPAAMNVKQIIREEFGLNGSDIPNDRLEEVMTFINGMNPKERE